MTYVDRARDLPVSIEAWRKDGGQWRLEVRGEMSFGERFADRLFRPDFPEPRTRVDMEKLRAEWSGKLAPSRIESSQSLDGRPVIRDFWVGKRGMVFLLYTAGRTRMDEPARRVELSDDAGTVYLDGQQGVRPLAPATVTDGQPIGLTIPGRELLDLAWWVPLVEPREQINGYVLTFPDKPGQPFVPSSRPMQFFLSARPSPDAVPGYAPAMFSAPTEARVKESAAMVRSKYLERAGDYPGAAAQWQTLIDIEDEEAKAAGVEVDPGQTAGRLIRAHVLYRRCGDRAAAHAALQRAADIYRSDGGIRDQIRQLMAQEGLP